MAVLKRYSIGEIRSIREMIAGSSDAPKALIESQRGTLLLKRRASGLEHANLVGFAHQVIIGCLKQGVCVPPLLGTIEDNNSMCQIGDQTYELFVYLNGSPFDQSTEHAHQAGQLLAELHHAMDSITTTFEPTTETSVVNPNRPLPKLESGASKKIRSILEYALEAHRANATTPAIIHGDWHPGNMIFDGPEIIGVCDFDNCRIGSREREIAQALVYLSMKRPSSSTPDTLPPELSQDHLVNIWKGYLGYYEQLGRPVSPNPHLIAALMPAVLLDEALAGLSPTSNPALLSVALTKAMWMHDHNNEIIRLLST